MTNLSTLTLKALGTDRAVVTPTPLSIMFDPRKGYAAVIQYRPRGVQYTTRVTLPWCTTREGARYTSEVACHYLMRPARPVIVPVAQELVPVNLTIGAVLDHRMQRAAPGSPPAQRPPQR